MADLTSSNVFAFFQRRPYGIPVATVLDTSGLDTPAAQSIISALQADGKIKLVAGTYFPVKHG